jgi:hypothetical protein
VCREQFWQEWAVHLPVVLVKEISSVPIWVTTVEEGKV